MNPNEQRALLNILVQAAMSDGTKADSERQFIRDLSQQLDGTAGAQHLAQAVQDALLKLMGVSPLAPAERFAVRADFALRKQPGRVEYLRGRLQRDGAEPTVAMAGAQGSGVLRSMSDADCFVVLPAHSVYYTHKTLQTIRSM